MSLENWKNREIHEPREKRKGRSERPIHPLGERPSRLNRFPFRIFGVFRGLNCRIQIEGSLVRWRAEACVGAPLLIFGDGGLHEES